MSNPTTSETPSGAVASSDLLAVIWREGCDANDFNRRLSRLQKSEPWRTNPYTPMSTEWFRWNEGYCYRDMVNDG